MREIRPRRTLTNKSIVLMLSENQVFSDAQAQAIANLTDALASVTAPVNNPTTTPLSVNQILNGTFSHSDASWDDTGAVNDTNLQCHQWFSHPITAGQAMYKDVVPGPAPTNYTLKEASHTDYDPLYADWDWATGSARMAGNNDLSCWFPGNNIEAGYSFYATFDIVKLNQYVTAPASARMWCGIYANSTALVAWDWLYGAYTITAEVGGTTVVTPTSRDYRVYAQTDRGFSVLSDVLTVANAPSNTDFNNGSVVVISWKPVLNYGVQTYSIYRKTGATYVKLFEVVTGQLTYIDNNTQTAAAGWPTGTFDALVAYTATIEGVLTNLPYMNDPLNPFWATIPFAIRVPPNYNKGDTVIADGQWLRWGFDGINPNGRFDMFITDGLWLDGSTTFTTTSSGQFTADMVGLEVIITGKGLDDPLRTEIASYTSANSIELDDAAPDDVDPAFIYINGGAPNHAVYVDLAHCDYAGSGLNGVPSFSPNPEDIASIRGIPPVAPNGTTQGGSGGGGGDPNDGQPVCLFFDELSVLESGESIRVADWEIGMWLQDGHGGLTQIKDFTDAIADVWRVETENGCGVNATLTHGLAHNGINTAIGLLQSGDKVETVLNGVMEESPIKAKYLLLKNQVVRKVQLHPTHTFLGGNVPEAKVGGIVSFNRKPIYQAYQA